MLAEGWWVHSFHNLDEPGKPSLPPNLFQPVTGAFALRPLLKINNKVQVAGDIDQMSQVRSQEPESKLQNMSWRVWSPALQGGPVRPGLAVWALGSPRKVYTWRAHGSPCAQDPCGLFQFWPFPVFQNTPKGIHTWHRGGGHRYKVLSEEAM